LDDFEFLILASCSENLPNYSEYDRTATAFASIDRKIVKIERKKNELTL